jgi:multicomponent Na+:H+ antiporter subunit D
MTNTLIPPGLVLIFVGLLLPFCNSVVRKTLLLLAPIIAFFLVVTIPEGHSTSVPFLDYQLQVLKHSTYGVVFAIIFSIMAFVGNLYGLHQSGKIEQTAAMVYIGSAMGVTLAGDLITVFLFWEIMAIGSTTVIWSQGSQAARKAGIRYLILHLFGGVILMFGVTGHIVDTNQIAFGPIPLDSLAHWLILAGFLVNAGAPPFSAWIPDAYPEASPSGSVYLSAFTTKTSVYVLLTAFAGNEILIYIGLYMVFYGIIYALLENDMRRILAYSIINQVGFMVTGIGIGSTIALNGVAAHAFCHIIYKALLLMSAGSVLFQTGKRKCTDLGGLFQTMPLTALCGIIGALAISAFPLTSGFISKSMISEGAALAHLQWVWYLLAAATAGVFLHAGIKFPWFVFFQKDSGMRPAEPPRNMRYAMYIFAFLCIGLGVYPDPLYALLKPMDKPYQAYTFAHVVTQLQLLMFSGLAFFLLLPMMKRTLTISLDLDWFYRKLFPSIYHFLNDVFVFAKTVFYSIIIGIRSWITGPESGSETLTKWSGKTEGMVLIVVASLAIFLVIYYFI